MNGLTKNWINFFHNSSLPTSLLYDVYEYLSSFTERTYVSIEELKAKFHVSGQEAISLLKGLAAEALCSLTAACPTCGAAFGLEKEGVYRCPQCDQEFSISTLDIAFITEKASRRHILLQKYEDEVYELNASLLSQRGTSEHRLFYLVTDVEDSQTQQRRSPSQYSLMLAELWTNVWPKVFRFARKPSLPLLARGDSVSIVYLDGIDLISAVEALADVLGGYEISCLTAYGSEIEITERDKIPFMRSIDKKWDLNSPSVTDLYRRISFKPSMWAAAPSARLKYCLFDSIGEIAGERKQYRDSPHMVEDYEAEDKHRNRYKGRCLTGYFA